MIKSIDEFQTECYNHLPIQFSNDLLAELNSIESDLNDNININNKLIKHPYHPYPLTLPTPSDILRGL